MKWLHGVWLARCSTEVVRSEATELTNCDIFPFEVNQAFQVLVGDFHLIFKGQIMEDFSYFKVMVDLVEEVRVSHGRRLYQLYLERKKNKFNYKTCLIE